MKTIHFACMALLSTALAGCGSVPFDIFGDIPESDFLKESSAPVTVDVGTLSLSTVGSPDEQSAIVGRPKRGIGQKGGVTATFTGTGDSVCFVADPQGSDGDLNKEDDGDSDLFVGLEADYTGTPGSVVGAFQSVYTDAIGVEHTDDSNQCVVEYVDSFGRPGAHMGKGVVEWCQIDTVAGANYILIAETFAVPYDDADLVVSVAVVETIDQGSGPQCPAINEQTLTADHEP